MAVNEPAGTAAPRFENKGILRFVEDSETVLARMDRSTIEIFFVVVEVSRGIWAVSGSHRNAEWKIFLAASGER